MEAYLQQKWRELCERTTTSAASSYVWTTILSLYSEAHRFYHNTEHIYELFQNLETLKELTLVSDVDSIEYAIFFHDIIYNPNSNDNEEASADLFQTHYQGLLPSEQVNKVMKYVLATKKHSNDDEQDVDLDFFLDLDLLILASSEERYLRYARSIRQEYLMHDDKAYRMGRIKVLEKFLDPNKQIYLTKYCQDEYEDKAKRNLTMEFQQLIDKKLL